MTWCCHSQDRRRARSSWTARRDVRTSGLIKREDGGPGTSFALDLHVDSVLHRAVISVDEEAATPRAARDYVVMTDDGPALARRAVRRQRSAPSTFAASSTSAAARVVLAGVQHLPLASGQRPLSRGSDAALELKLAAKPARPRPCWRRRAGRQKCSGFAPDSQRADFILRAVRPAARA